VRAYVHESHERFLLSGLRQLGALACKASTTAPFDLIFIHHDISMFPVLVEVKTHESGRIGAKGGTSDLSTEQNRWLLQAAEDKVGYAYAIFRVTEATAKKGVSMVHVSPQNDRIAHFLCRAWRAGRGLDPGRT